MHLLQIAQVATETVAKTTAAAQGFLNSLTTFAGNYVPKLIGAILFYIIGSFVIRKITSLLGKALSRKNYDASLQGFLVSAAKISLLILLLISIMGILGIDTTAFAGLLIGASLAIGSALNGTLGNFAGGVMMLVFRPFKVGDIVEAQGVCGTVIEQGIFNTTLLTPDNKTVIVPNGPLSTNIITNFNTHGNLRVDLQMAIANDQDLDKARQIAIDAMKNHPKVLQTPAPEVNVLKVADFMTTLAIRPYTTQTDYWDVYFGAQELVKKAFDEYGIQGPTPTRIVFNK
ncbi:MAG: Small-conductance mechanosensitive channel [Bacteroidota bacterium]|jgi:small conductance mechanosensitive channel